MFTKKSGIIITSLFFFSIFGLVSAYSNDTNSEKINNQYVVVLKSTTSNQTVNSLIEELTINGIKIIAIYDQPILKGFAFSSDNASLTQTIIDFLNNQTEVEYVTPDKEAIIFNN